MQKQKKAITKKPVFTRTLHPNRWFIWTVSALVIVLIGLFAYISISSLNDSAQQSYSPLQPRTSPVYTNATLGFSLQYPEGWVIDTSSNTSITFDNPQNSAESLTVSKATSTSIAQLEKSSSVSSKNTYNNNGFQVTVLSVKNTEGGADIKIGIVQSAKSSFIVTGDSDQFTTVLNSVHPLQ